METSRRRRGAGRSAPSETSLEGWKQPVLRLQAHHDVAFRNFLRGMETGVVNFGVADDLVLPKLP